MKKGDIVILKSGGTKMTLESFDGGLASCVWFDGTKIKKHSFVLETLQTLQEHYDESEAQAERSGL